MSDIHTANKALIVPLRAAMYDFSEPGVRVALEAMMAPDATCRFAHPLRDMTGPEALYDTAYAPLFEAIPDLEEWRVGGVVKRLRPGHIAQGMGDSTDRVRGHHGIERRAHARFRKVVHRGPQRGDQSFIFGVDVAHAASSAPRRAAMRAKTSTPSWR